MHTVGAKTRAAGIGKENLAVAARWFAEPGSQHGDRGLGERYTPFFATLSDHANVSTWTEYYVLACQPGHFRQTKPCLHRDQEEGVIAPTEPGLLIGRGDQCLDLRTREEMHLGPGEALVWDGQHALDLGSMFWRFEPGISKEGMNGS